MLVKGDKMTKINMNAVAKEILQIETYLLNGVVQQGRKVELNTVQIKEVCNRFLSILANDFEPEQLVELINKYR
jgi:sRNA-binding regulator protein Hfq